jgi:hypothetical protein
MLSTITAISQQGSRAKHVERFASFTTDETSPELIEARRLLQVAQEDVVAKMAELGDLWSAMFRRRTGGMDTIGGGLVLDRLIERVTSLERSMPGTSTADKGKGRAIEAPLPTPTSALPQPGLGRIRIANSDGGPESSEKGHRVSVLSDQLSAALVKVDSMETLLLGFDERFNEFENRAYLTDMNSRQERGTGGEEKPVDSWDELENQRDPTRRLRGPIRERADPRLDANRSNLERDPQPTRQIGGNSGQIQGRTAQRNGDDPRRKPSGPDAIATQDAKIAEASAKTQELINAYSQKLEEQAGLVSSLRSRVRSMGEDIAALKEEKDAQNRQREEDKHKLEDTGRAIATLREESEAQNRDRAEVKAMLESTLRLVAALSEDKVSQDRDRAADKVKLEDTLQGMIVLIKDECTTQTRKVSTQSVCR